MKFFRCLFWRVAIFFYVGHACTAFAESKTKPLPLVLPDFLNHLDATGTEPWSPPDFSGQEGALGYFKGAFDVPKGMEARVNFWKDIYTKYSTDQGVIHDSQFIDIVYAEVDFREIMENMDLNLLQKEKQRRKLVEDKKKEIEELLRKLSEVKDPRSLSQRELKIWKAFEKVPSENKFLEAAEKNRLRFQLGQKNRFLLGIYYSGFYLPEMEKIYRAEKMPVELTRLPFVESSFNVRARSRVGASGIWQFMRGTAKRYLVANASMDERNDPLKATQAAARFLRLNYQMLEKWPLAVTAYNHGPSGVKRMVKKFDTDDIVELVDARHGRFQFASSNFFASFLAALEVEKNAAKYFGSVVRARPKQTRQLLVDGKINKSRLRREVVLAWFDGNKDLAELYNPHIKGGYWTGKLTLVPGTFLRIPEAKWMQVQTDLFGAKAPEIVKVPVSVAAKTPVEVAGESEVTTSTVEADQPIIQDQSDLSPIEVIHVVNRGETIEQLADTYGIPIRSILEINNLQPHRPLKRGSRLVIPLK